MERRAIMMTIFSVVSAFGQSRAELEAKFGQPVKAYSVSQSIWIWTMLNAIKEQ